VQERCGLEGRWRWLTGPLALLTWWRSRREAALALEAFRGVTEALLGVLEDFRAGRLVAERAPVGAADEEAMPCAERQPGDRYLKARGVATGTRGMPASAGMTGNVSSTGEAAGGADGAAATPHFPPGVRRGESPPPGDRKRATPFIADDGGMRPAFAGLSGPTGGWRRPFFKKDRKRAGDQCDESVTISK